MTPRKIQTRSGGRGDARNRRLVAEKYLEVGELTQDESGAAVNVTVGIAVRDLVELKPASHYGSAILTADDSKRAMRNAAALMVEAQKRTR